MVDECRCDTGLNEYESICNFPLAYTDDNALAAGYRITISLAGKLSYSRSDDVSFLTSVYLSHSPSSIFLDFSLA